jgi:hypothetical protein
VPIPSLKEPSVTAIAFLSMIANAIGGALCVCNMCLRR